MSGMKPRKLEFLFTPAQKAALDSHQQLPSTSASSCRCCCTALPARARPRFICRQCRRCWRKGARRSCWFRRSVSLRRWRPICTRSSATRLPFCIPRLSDDERAEQWKHIRNGESHIVVGTRSAIFAPGSRPGAHRGRRGARPLLQAGRDAALPRARRGRDARQDVAMPPSCWARPRRRWRPTTTRVQGKYRLLELPERIEKRPLPEVEILDMREEFQRDAERRRPLAQAGGRNWRAPGAQRAGDGAAEPARLFGIRALPRVRRDACSARTAPSP